MPDHDENPDNRLHPGQGAMAKRSGSEARPCDASEGGMPAPQPRACSLGMAPGGGSPSETAPTFMAPDATRHAIRWALLGKEWREQRWRFFLGTLVLACLLGGMLRAQVIPPHEAAILIYWPVGIIMVIFLAMGSVATERADRTWEFLIAQPVSRADVLFTKWAMGLVQLVGMLAIATIVGVLALLSRHGFGRTSYMEQAGAEAPGTMIGLLLRVAAHPTLALSLLGLIATASLVSWYTPLFLMLTRARNEFTAALGGIMLTIALHAWLAQFVVAARNHGGFFLITASANPIAPFVMAIHPALIWLAPFSIIVYPLVWVVLPMWLFLRHARRAPVQ